MLSINQGVALIIAIALTIMFLMIGYQILQILQELKESVQKLSHILDDAGRVSASVAQPVESFSGFINGLKSGSQLLGLITSLKSKNDKQ